MNVWDTYKVLWYFYKGEDYTVSVHHRQWNKKIIPQLELLHDLKICAKWKEKHKTFYKLIYPEYSPHNPMHKKFCTPNHAHFLFKQPCAASVFFIKKYNVDKKYEQLKLFELDV